MALKFANNASSILAANLAVGGTTISLRPGDGVFFPTLGVGETFTATLFTEGGVVEIVTVTARTSDTLTVVRAQEGTAALFWPVNSRIEMRVTAGLFDSIWSAITALQTSIASTVTSIADLVADLADSAGSSLIGYIQSGVGAIARTIQAKLRERVSVMDYGAVGDGVTDDTAAILAAATAAFGKCLFFPKPPGGYYQVSLLQIDPATQTIHWEGEGSFYTRIRKTGNTTGSGSALAPGRSGLVTDTFVSDAALIIKHPANDYAYYPRFKGISFFSNSTPNTIGIYCPRSCYGHWEDVTLWNFTNSFFTYDTFMTTFIDVMSFNGGVANSRGFRWANDGSGLGTGTSCTFTRCYSLNTKLGGYVMFGLAYSTFNSCGSDAHNGGAAYDFQSCSGIVMNGCGFENNTPAASGGLIVCTQSDVVINGGKGINNTGASGAASIKVDGGNVVMNGLRFTDWVTVNSALNLSVVNGGKLTSIRSVLPSNGSSTVTYTGGAEYINLDTGTVFTSASRMYPLQTKVSGVRQENLAKTVLSAGSDIFTVTLATSQASAFVDLHLYGNDTSFQNGAVKQFVQFVFNKESGAAYYQNSSIVNSVMCGSAGYVTPPAYSITRSGDTWTVKCTPAHGDIAADLVAECRGVAGTPTFAWS